MSVDLNQALEDVIHAGIHRVLTSGGQQRAEDGIATIARLVAAANNRIAFMVGGVKSGKPTYAASSLRPEPVRFTPTWDTPSPVLCSIATPRSRSALLKAANTSAW
jgi:copper homeostasis protein